MIPLCAEAVSCVILRKNESGAVEQLLVKRCPQDGDFWSHVGGGVNAEETAVEAIVREIKEETGLVPRQLYNGEFIEQFYQVDKNRILVMPVFVAFVDPEQTVVLNDEHTDFLWCAYEVALTKVPFHGQRTLYEHVWKLFAGDGPNRAQQII